MNRFFLCCIVTGICGVSALFADETARAVQTRLKADGFYFGDVNGTYDSETAAAVSRYQIRNGLPITGQLDAETTKALGVAATASTAPALRADSQSWQRLRKSDRQFLSQVNNSQSRSATGSSSPPTAKAQTTTRSTSTTTTAPPGPPATARTADAAPRAVVQQDTSDPSTLVLSRERLRDYVGAFVLAGLDPRVGAELEFFADRVNYYNEGVVSRDKIRRDLQAYSQRWPQRRFWLAGEVKVEPQADSRLLVTFPLRYELSGASKRSAGKLRKMLTLEVTGEDLQIVGVNEQKMR